MRYVVLFCVISRIAHLKTLPGTPKYYLNGKRYCYYINLVYYHYCLLQLFNDIRFNESDQYLKRIVHKRWMSIATIMKITSTALHFFKSLLPPLCFLHIHYVYFIGTCLIASLILWISSTPSESVAYVDSLFMAISAMTETGLNTINLNQLNIFQQVILWFLMIIGSPIFVSTLVIGWRRRAFSHRIKSKQEKGSKFSRMTRGQKDTIGGKEYRAIRILSYVVPTYLILWQVIGAISLSAYISLHLSNIATQNGVGPWYILCPLEMPV